jgi:hemoglobin
VPGGNVTMTSQTTTPLYARLVGLAGTEEVFGVVAERLYARILGPVDGDPDLDGDLHLIGYFRGADGRLIDRARLQQHMTHFLMAALGGPRRYSGRSMESAHAGRAITDEAFDRVIAHVVAVLESMRVPAPWITEIGAAVAPLRAHVVTATA